MLPPNFRIAVEGATDAARGAADIVDYRTCHLPVAYHFPADAQLLDLRMRRHHSYRRLIRHPLVYVPVQLRAVHGPHHRTVQRWYGHDALRRSCLTVEYARFVGPR